VEVVDRKSVYRIRNQHVKKYINIKFHQDLSCIAKLDLSLPTFGKSSLDLLDLNDFAEQMWVPHTGGVFQYWDYVHMYVLKALTNKSLFLETKLVT